MTLYVILLDHFFRTPIKTNTTNTEQDLPAQWKAKTTTTMSWSWSPMIYLRRLSPL